MDTENKQVAKAHNFSAAFEQMCSIVAIGKTRDRIETLCELILYCLVFLPDEKLFSANEFVNTIDGLFGINIPEHEIQYAVDHLLKSGSITKHPNEIFSLPRSVKESIQKNINEAYALEEKVRNTWQLEVEEKFPILEFSKIWRALKLYLAKAFQRHGIQAAALLDPGIEIAQEYIESLSSILYDVIKKSFPQEVCNAAQNAISGFMATTGNHPERAIYITQLADGAFNYYSLTIDSKVASEFQKNLSSLEIFFDTNFLFGILDITVNPQVAVSNELLRAIEKHKLPFRLYSHQKTIKELQSSIDHYEEVLKSKKWSRQISRAAAVSRQLSGVELRYHQRFAEEGVDVESFFMPFRHVDILLKNKNIVPFNSKQDSIEEKSMLIAEYIEFLGKRNKDKFYELIDHDMTVLNVVRQKRTNAKSTLEAGALLITCDFTLYKFDWEDSKNKKIKASTVLPNIFWQVLRPFIPSDVDFDRSFAETFAIPEFRIFGSKASEACSKMLSILAGYKDFPEETAARMLSNDLLIEKLQSIADDKVFQELVDSEIVRENAALLEEKAIITERLDKERKEKERNIIALEREKQQRFQLEAEKQELQEITQKDLEHERSAKLTAEQRVVAAEKAKQDANTEKLAALMEAKKEKERADLIVNIAKSILLGVLLVALFEGLVFGLNFSWLISHAHGLGIQASIDAILLLLSFAIFIKKGRNWIFLSLIIPIVVGLFQILDNK